MSIFMISPKVTEPTDEQKEPGVATVPAADGNAATAITDKPAGEVVPEVGFMTQKQIDEKTIVVDGPLSQVYTQALDQAYAKESYMATEVPEIGDLKDKVDANYLYVIGDGFEDDGALQTAFSDLETASGAFDKLFICCEHEFKVTPNLSRLLSFARSKGATVLHSREAAMEMIAHTVKLAA